MYLSISKFRKRPNKARIKSSSLEKITVQVIAMLKGYVKNLPGDSLEKPGSETGSEPASEVAVDRSILRVEGTPEPTTLATGRCDTAGVPK